MVFVSEVCLPVVPQKALAWKVLGLFFFKVVNRDASLSKPMAMSQEHLNHVTWCLNPFKKSVV